jgi:VWFA-related protein
MDVSVLDKDRRPVQGLTAADFTILENDKPQPIVAFDAVDLPDIESTSAAWMRDAPVDVVRNDRLSRRVVLIVFDDVLISVDRTNDVKRVAHEIVDRLGPDDLGAVTFTETGRRQDLTSDHERLLKAVDSFLPHGNFKNSNDPPMPCLFTGPYATKASCIVDVLVTASKALLAAPQGRKTLVYVSEGFAYMPRFDYRVDARTDMQQPIPVGPKPVRVPDPTAYFNTVLAMQTALTNLQRANVNVYAIDPSGVTEQGITGPAKDWLRIFSEDTGGTATLFTNTPWEAVPTIFRENSSYYLLAFKPTPLVNDGRFHPVKVRIDRKDVEVRVRSGYYAPNPAASSPASSASPRGEASTPLEEAIRFPMSGGDLAMATTVAPFAMPDQKTAALAIVTRLRDPLAAGDRTIEIATRALDADCGDCKKLPSTYQRETFTVRSGDTSGAELLSRLMLPPGNYEIRVAASLGDQLGTLLTHVDVPDFRKAKLSASGVVLSATPSVMTNDQQILSDFLPVVATARREFDRDVSVTAFMRFYQTGSKTATPVQVTTTILDAHDRRVLDQPLLLGADRFAVSKSSDFKVDLPLATLESGAYLLTIAATAGSLKVTRQVRFWVK